MIDSGSIGLGSSPGIPATKRCYRCKETKPTSQFHKHSSRKDGLQSCCKPCKSLMSADYHKHGRDLEKFWAQRAIHKERNRAYVFQYLMTHPCIDCGETDVVVLEFDHLSDKVDSISSMMSQVLSLRRIIAEIEKCEVRCANDHRRATARRAGQWKTRRGSSS